MIPETCFKINKQAKQDIDNCWELGTYGFILIVCLFCYVGTFLVKSSETASKYLINENMREAHS